MQRGCLNKSGAAFGKEARRSAGLYSGCGSAEISCGVATVIVVVRLAGTEIKGEP